ncbi:hypothetical protein [Rubinisphaera sp.]|uniref:DUF6933 domain-containing protein n=1 Tax=Rubinisphaera sp. TaxID=2024857 RepID=UPI000C0E4FFB|nr:hypothetical protein [Rubinisphaera sp.]MBV09105.1 hypothetical protein [Rubinisphaera sp.]|tara:strand:+ start:4043 stop:4561 length:519 start_codon:yes stop_codon:yes gene_type:complete
MIFRLSQKLSTKIKAGKLKELPLEENPITDWSAHLFVVDHTQYIIMSNTASMYSCVMYGDDINHDNQFIQRAFSTIREFMEEDGLLSIYEEFIIPSSGTISFAKALNRQVTGSMNELVMTATSALESEEIAPHDLGFELNNLLLSAIATKEDRGYGRPKEAFRRLVDQKRND